MKKTFLTCMAVVALFAIATGASAITCTIDQRPAATLLIPYFQATVNQDGSPCGVPPCTAGGTAALDTLVTIGNASSAPMLAHVAIWSERSELVLDFNIALTGFDIQSWSMARVLTGVLPVTPVNQSHVPEVKDGHQVVQTGDVCQRIGAPPLSILYPATGGYLREYPNSPANSLDNTSATVAYPIPAFGGAFMFTVLDSLDSTPDSFACGGTDSNGTLGLTNPLHGYITIDHENYCTLSNPDQAKYWTQDAAGFENNLFGDYIYTSSAGIGTMGFPAIAIEADPSLADNTPAPNLTTDLPGRRTFYRRYVTNADLFDCVNSPKAPSFDCGFGDQREPLGLKYAARWFDTSVVTSNFSVWRASAVPSNNIANGLADLLGAPSGKCNTSETNVTLAFYDEDENTVTTGVCPSPPRGCLPSQFNFPLETQRVNITNFPHPNWPAGWVSMEFFNPNGMVGGTLDQAYVAYDFQGPTQFLSAGMPAAQLDPTNCQPLLVPCAAGQPTVGGPGGSCYGPPSPSGVTTTAPEIPLIVGTGPS